jgi:hypothetical protein
MKKPALCVLFLLFGFSCLAQNKTVPAKGYTEYRYSLDSCESWILLFNDSSFLYASFGCFNDERTIGYWRAYDSAIELTSDTTVIHRLHRIQLANRCSGRVHEMFERVIYFIDVYQQEYPNIPLATLFQHKKLLIDKGNLICNKGDVIYTYHRKD